MTDISFEERSAVSNELPDFSSVPGAAAYLSVHPALIYKEIRAGRLLAVKVGLKVLRIPRAALEAYIQAQLNPGAN